MVPGTSAPETASDPAATPYIDFSREAWAELRNSTPLTLSESDLAELQGINESVSMREVEEVYLPLSRLLNLHIGATRELHSVTDTFLGGGADRVPYIIGIAGSVAVGKSTTARILRALLARWPEHPKVDLVTTDGFLFPNEVLEARGIMNRKGFPESYDRPRLIRFVADLKAGAARVEAPVYSHLTYDIMPDERLVLERPDIVIVEGLNVLQSGTDRPVFVSDFFDFSIYVDAREEDLHSWFLDRFLQLRRTAFRDPSSYFRRFAELTREDAVEFAERVWREINLLNLRENIAPTRERAHLVLEKGPLHGAERVRLRRM